MSAATARLVPEAPIAGPPRTRWALKTRSLSAIFLAVPVLACLLAGSPFIEALVITAAMVLLWEWCRLCSPSFPYSVFTALGGCVTAATVAAGLGYWLVALAVLIGGAFVVHLLTDGGWWLGAGALYIGLPCVAIVWLRDDPVFGRDTVLWVFALVWASDIGGYVFGRLIGGRKLAPRLSPNKTWAGFFGATACAGAVGAATAALVEIGSVWALVALSAVMGGATQLGDLFESWVKRRFGVKDTSRLIPGHGGLLDRVDGLLAASTLTALIAVVGNGSIFGWI